MGRRNKKRKKNPDGTPRVDAAPDAGELEAEALSGRGKKTIAAGIGVLIVGFVILTFTDPAGKNWASTVSPLLILGAYAVIALGIFMPEGETQEAPAVPADAEPTTKDLPETN